jgi:hypothetical protein
MLGGTAHNLKVCNQVYDVGTASWVAMTQPLLSTDTLTVSGSMAVTNWPLEYELADYDGTDPMYIGNVTTSGAWRIEKFSPGDKTMRYCKGSSSYSTNWTNRADLTYTLTN